eukprot:m.265377 g.265377  ORF g.265377 m.265377 type:complete len:404 (+) comp19715_c1_seq59:408-1619(+)
MWRCSVCTFHNDQALAPVCDMCRSERSRSPQRVALHAESAPDPPGRRCKRRRAQQPTSGASVPITAGPVVVIESDDDDANDAETGPRQQTNAVSRMEQNGSLKTIIAWSDGIRAKCTAATAPVYTGIVASGVDFFPQNKKDRRWSCGYCNIQMLCSYLLRHNAMTSVPNIGDIQRDIQAAWHRGWDPTGAAQLSNRLNGTRKWIGATEAVVYFRSRGLVTHVVDFRSTASAGGRLSLARARTSPPDNLLQWVRSYFTAGTDAAFRGREGTEAPAEGNIVFVSGRCPLYFQHSGHSRTIVGVELCNRAQRRAGDLHHADVTALLVFDPAVSSQAMRAGMSVGQRGACVRVEPHRLCEAQYQIVYVVMETRPHVAGGHHQTAVASRMPPGRVVSCEHASETVVLA